MAKVMIVAPHPDDETLGCGGTLFRHKSEGDDLYWLIGTEMDPERYSQDQIATRNNEIQQVSDFYGFNEVFRLGLPCARIDVLPLSDIIEALGKIFFKIKPEILYIPFRADAHSDHKVIYDACMAHTKWFRNQMLREIFIYEVTSETDFQCDITVSYFHPNVYVDIKPFLQKKLKAMELYADQTGEFPFPRSFEAIDVLAKKRGVESGFSAAEGFMLFKQRRPL